MGDRVPQVFEDQHVGPGATVISGGGRGADIIAAASAQNAHFGTQWKRSCDCEVADHNGGLHAPWRQPAPVTERHPVPDSTSRGSPTRRAGPRCQSPP